MQEVMKNEDKAEIADQYYNNNPDVVEKIPEIKDIKSGEPIALRWKTSCVHPSRAYDG